MLRDLETQLLARLTPLKQEGFVKSVVPWVADDSPQPDDDEMSKVLESLDTAVLVTLAEAESLEHTGRTKTHEEVRVLLTLYLANKSAQDTVTRGDARRIGVYDLIDLVRTRVENVPVVDHPGSRYQFRAHRRVGYSRGKITWQIEYRARLERRFDADAIIGHYNRILGVVLEPEEETAQTLEFQRELVELP